MRNICGVRSLVESAEGEGKTYDEEHDMTSEGSGLSVHDSRRRLLANLSQLDVDHVDICGISSCLSCLESRLTMSGSVNDGPEEHTIGDLSMEPDVLVERDEPGERRTEDAHRVAKD